MPTITVIRHPLVQRDLAVLRAADTSHALFRKTLTEVSVLLAYEALRDLAVREIQVQTPLELAVGHVLADEVVVVPILRAGLGMLDGTLRLVPEARVGHMGLYRDEATFEPVSYYMRLPAGLDSARVVILDPMLATGGSVVEAVRRLKAAGARRLCVVSLVAAPEGVERLAAAYPDVPVVAAALDRALDENAYIRPGLGDAGDRVFGTDP
jgi:uracil phosphoribosyltransferase